MEIQEYLMVTIIINKIGTFSCFLQKDTQRKKGVKFQNYDFEKKNERDIEHLFGKNSRSIFNVFISLALKTVGGLQVCNRESVELFLCDQVTIGVQARFFGIRVSFETLQSDYNQNLVKMQWGFFICDSSHRNLPVVGWLHLAITPKKTAKY